MPDSFETLGVDKQFDLDEANLHARYIAASAAAHPDRTTDPLEQAEAAERASLINDAYRKLADPEMRARELLAVLGGTSKQDNDALPPDLLMEMMEVRERLEDAVASGNASELAKLQTWAGEQRKQRLGAISDLFNASPPDLPGIKLQLNALRYIERMLEQMP